MGEIDSSEVAGAGEGNRTLVISLEGFCSTIELHPPDSRLIFLRAARSRRPAKAPETGGGGWIRTNVGARPTDLQSAPFSRSGTPPAEPAIILGFPRLGQAKAGRNPNGWSQVPKRTVDRSALSAAMAL